MVAQLSSRVFLGEEICRDEEWLNVSVNFTIDAFIAARILRLWPSILRPAVHWFLPWSRRMRDTSKIPIELSRERSIKEN